MWYQSYRIFSKAIGFCHSYLPKVILFLQKLKDEKKKAHHKRKTQMVIHSTKGRELLEIERDLREYSTFKIIFN